MHSGAAQRRKEPKRTLYYLAHGDKERISKRLPPPPLGPTAPPLHPLSYPAPPAARGEANFQIPNPPKNFEKKKGKSSDPLTAALPRRNLSRIGPTPRPAALRGLLLSRRGRGYAGPCAAVRGECLSPRSASSVAGACTATASRGGLTCGRCPGRR